MCHTIYLSIYLFRQVITTEIIQVVQQTETITTEIQRTATVNHRGAARKRKESVSVAPHQVTKGLFRKVLFIIPTYIMFEYFTLHCIRLRLCKVERFNYSARTWYQNNIYFASQIFISQISNLILML